MTPPEARALRVFFALWPDAAVCAALHTLARDCAVQTGGRAPAASNLHLTLAFIGDATASRVATLREIGKACASAVPPFTLSLDRIGAFHKQGIGWAAPSSPDPAIGRLALMLSDRLGTAGFEQERRAFHPHVTLVRRGRTRVLDSTPGSIRLAAPIVWNVERMMLAASEPTQGAPRYVALDAWPLGEGGEPV